VDKMQIENETHGLRYYTAQIAKPLEAKLPEGKRLPQGWTAVQVGSEDAESVLELKWQDADGLADSLFIGEQEAASAITSDYRLRISVALDYREAQYVEARLLSTGERVGRFDIRFAYVFQPFEITLSREQAAAALREGVSLVVDGGEQPLWIFDEQGGDAQRQLLAPHLLVGERVSNSAQNDRKLAAAMNTLSSLSSLQPFGWMEGCVLDGLFALRQVLGAERVDPALDVHLAQYLDAEGRLLYEDLHGRKADGTFTTIEATLPLAVIAKYRTEHPVVKQAIAFWDARGASGDGAVIDDDTVSAEGAYTVAYPLAAIASRHGRVDLAQQAVRQVLLRRDCLAQGRDVYLRYHQNSDTHTFRNWARAFAWYMLGTTRTYIELRESAFAGLPGVAEIEHELIRVAEVSLTWRQSEGLWSNFLDEADIGIDTSGSAGIAAALALGVRHGVLSSHYLEVAEESLNALADYLTPDGILSGVAQHNAGGPELQRGGYRVLSQMGLGLLGQLYAAVRG
jgi:unsaturated rhamnogalacturonyl hydrolase